MKDLRKVFSTLKRESPILYWIVILMFAGGLGCLLGLFIDGRTLAGINVWIKPLKFFISTAIYTLSVGFFITFYPYSNTKKHSIRNVVSWTLLLEVLIIAVQAARGVQSHFNNSNSTDFVLFRIMGILIGINVVIMVLLLFDTLRLKLKLPKVVQWALVLGWAITIFGSWVGGQMIGQMAHNVGGPDGGAGLPLLNWSTRLGDLRVAHFFGLHSIQLLPLLALLIHRHWKTKHSNQVLVLTLSALVYAAFIFYTFYQAKQEIPFIAV